MRTFHTGGVAGAASDITTGLPRVVEIFEARIPSVKAIIADVDGQVTAVEEKGTQFLIKIKSDKNEEREYLTLPGTVSWVSVGDLVTNGQQLSEGHVDLKELYATSGSIQTVARYIIREVQSVYFATGDGINNKHVELITRQMFSHVKVLSGGDTELLPGDIVERRTLLESNIVAAENKGAPATAENMLLGITKVSLTTESFLSAASFQETAKILIEASISGKEDKLRGLKENVIIGRLIPAGTGYNEEIMAEPLEIPEN
jgi:DNA-directed RNA polymerase subunit beta'